MRPLRLIMISALLSVFAATAQASWYDEYEAGLRAVRAGQWSVVVDRMTKAIAGNPTESNKARTYGTIFINYHPYYYRGIAYLNLGRYEQAISDLEKANGIGPENLGTIESNMQRVRDARAAAAVPAPQPPAPQPVAPQPPPIQTPVPVPQPVIPQPQPPAPQPAGLTIDPAIRRRAQTELTRAKEQIDAARARRADRSPEFSSALQTFTDATSRLANATTNDELVTVMSLAGSAARLAQNARVTPSDDAEQIVLSPVQTRLRSALQSYFDGEFAEAVTAFTALSKDLPNNGWIWAFLGAAQYSRYAFEADEKYRQDAISSFRKARRFGFRDGLPARYFSRRIRQAFEQTAG